MYIPQEEEIRKEKEKARQLRATQWWKRKCAKGVCYYCGRRVSAKELTMDHIVPISR
ncbi:MAG: HNH endonuclease [Desulfosalsimonas sp.]